MNSQFGEFKFKINALNFDNFIEDLSAKVMAEESLCQLENEYIGTLSAIRQEASNSCGILAPGDPWQFVLEKIVETTRQCQQTIHKSPITEHLPCVDFLVNIYNRCMGQRRWYDWLVGGYEKQIMKIVQQMPIVNHPHQESIHCTLRAIRQLEKFAKYINQPRERKTGQV